jgi:hypothetical protein
MNRAERWTAPVLLSGGLVAVALMVLGVIGSALWGARALGHAAHTIATAGIVTLFATPLAAVATAGVAFAVDRDWRFVRVSAVVFTLLTLSVWLGLG